MSLMGGKFIREITSYIFIEDRLDKADVIFVPGGSWPEPAEKAAQLYLEKYATYILPSGKYSMSKGYFPGAGSKTQKYLGNYSTEWEFMKDVLLSYGVDEASILKEDEATWTKENAFNSRKVTDSNNLKIEKAIICCKSFHAKRSLMFYSWAYPETEFIVCPVDVEGISKNSWFESENGIEKVMGEFSRCGGQFRNVVKTWLK